MIDFYSGLEASGEEVDKIFWDLHHLCSAGKKEAGSDNKSDSKKKETAKTK